MFFPDTRKTLEEAYFAMYRAEERLHEHATSNIVADNADYYIFHIERDGSEELKALGKLMWPSAKSLGEYGGIY